jgi:CHAD domain-containing protein
VTFVPPPGGAARAALLPAAARLQRDLANRVTTFLAVAERVRVRADDEAIHDLRVALRRLTAATRIWQDLLRKRGFRRARRDMRALRQRVGPIRELEVDVAQLREMLSGVSIETTVAIEAFLVRLERRLRRAKQEAARAVRPSAAQELSRDLEAAMEGFVARALLADPMTIARQRITSLRTDARAALAEGVARGDDAALHRARIAIKKWRYALESAQPLFERTLDLSPLRDLQQALGQAHDRAVLIARIERRAHRLAEHGALAHAAALAAVLGRLTLARRKAVKQVRVLAAELRDPELPAVEPPPVFPPRPVPAPAADADASSAS